MPTIRRSANTSATGPHKGAVIHHHDQAITLHNFKTINTIASIPKKPMPPLEFVLLITSNLNVFVSGSSRTRTYKPFY